MRTCISMGNVHGLCFIYQNFGVPHAKSPRSRNMWANFLVFQQLSIVANRFICTWCVNLWRYRTLSILLTSVGTLILCRLNLFLLSKNAFNHAVCYTSKFSNFLLTMLYWTPKSIFFLPVGYGFMNHQASQLSLYILLHTLLHLKKIFV